MSDAFCNLSIKLFMPTSDLASGLNALAVCRAANRSRSCSAIRRSVDQFQLDVVVESIAADLVAAEFVAVIVAVFVLVLVDFAADSAVAAVAAVAAVGLDSEQPVEQAEDPFRVVELVAVVFPLVNGVVGSSPHHP